MFFSIASACFLSHSFLTLYWCWLNHEKSLTERWRQPGMTTHDHTSTGWAGPSHRGCFTEIYSLCTAGPYLFPCCSLPHLCLCLLTLSSCLYWLAINLKEENVIIPLAPFSFCLLLHTCNLNQSMNITTYCIICLWLLWLGLCLAAMDISAPWCCHFVTPSSLYCRAGLCYAYLITSWDRIWQDSGYSCTPYRPKPLNSTFNSLSTQQLTDDTWSVTGQIEYLNSLWLSYTTKSIYNITRLHMTCHLQGLSLTVDY